MIPSLDSLFQGGNATTRNVVLASAAVLATGLALYSFLGTSGTAAGVAKLAPALDEEETRKIMSSILEKLQGTVPKLLGAAENIKQQIVAQGQQLEDAQLLKMFILPHLQTALREAQDAVLEQFDVDDDELEEAVNEYIAAGDPELTRISTTIKQIFKKFGADIDTSSGSAATTKESAGGSSSAANLDPNSLENLLRILRIISKATADKTEEFIATFVNNYGPPVSEMLAMQFQHGLMYASQR